MKIEKYDELIKEGESFIGKNITASNPQFQSWNNTLIRFIERVYGKDSTTLRNFKDRSYTLSIFGLNTPNEEFVKALESDLKTSIADLKALKKEAENGELENITNSSKIQKSSNGQTINLNISNSNTNINNITLSIDDIRKNIDDNTMLGDKEKEELLKKLDEIKELQESNKTKNEKWKIAKEIFKFILDKGADIAIMYIPQILKALTN